MTNFVDLTPEQRAKVLAMFDNLGDTDCPTHDFIIHLRAQSRLRNYITGQPIASPLRLP